MTDAGQNSLPGMEPDRPSDSNRLGRPHRAHLEPRAGQRQELDRAARSHVAWNPVKEAELASCSADGTVRIWDVRSKGCVADIKTGGEGFTLAWHPDGSVLMVGRKVRLPQLTASSDRSLLG